MSIVTEQEWGFRVRRWEQVRDQFADEIESAVAEAELVRSEPRAELEGILERFRAGGSAEELKTGLDAWSRGARRWGFAGPNGAMFLNQLVNDSDDAVIESFLRRATEAPVSDEAARALMDELDAHVDELRLQGSSAQTGRVAPFLSWFWWVADPEPWPMLWVSIWRAFNRMGFGLERTTSWELYATYREHTRRFGPFPEIEMIAGALEESGDYGIDITTCDRLAVVAETNTPEAGPEAFAECQRSLELLREMAKSFGKEVASVLRSVFHCDIDFRQPSVWWDSRNNVLRKNLYLTWTPVRGVPSPSMMLLADGHQVQVGLHGSSMRSGNKGLSRRTFDVLELEHPDGVDWMMFAGHELEPGRSLAELPGSAVLGSPFPIEQLADHGSAVSQVRSMAERLLPAFEAVWAAETQDEAPPIRAKQPVESDDGSILSLKEQFVAEARYPDEADMRHRRTQKEWERLLTPGNLASVPLSELRRMYNGSTYGAPGPQSILNTTLSDEDPVVVDRFRSAIEYLLWGDDPVVSRIDTVMDENRLGLRGFKEGVIMKFLAVGRPDEFLAVYPFTGSMGKAAMLQALGQDVPSMSVSVGQRQVQANNALMATVSPLFPDDPWAQSRFLYWLMARVEDTGLTLDDSTSEPDEDRVGAAANDLLLPRSFLDEVHQLLEQHRQVIFYGPPGTGKTYVAQRLAEALAPSDEHRALVQFHPSTSYEDFFEGYRPLATGDDRMVYKLVSGPLRIMAERAASDVAERPHILIIDEINRANLAKVLGELLFLLEYRDSEIHPLYRPSETFSLPKNLWIIGTMNTADRSIATVDAALRRRFHFVPFVPGDQPDNPIGGLLAKWLNENDEPEWVAGLVDGVNQKLRKEMGGDHLALGPSYFMKKGLGRESLALIWKYQIEPLIDDLFFGDDRAKSFRFDVIWAELGAAASEAE